MLTVIVSKNQKNIKKELEKIVGTLPVLKMDCFSFDLDTIRSEIESKSLFGGEDRIFLVKDLSDDLNFYNEFKSLALNMSSSPKSFVLLEQKILKSEKEFFKKNKAILIEDEDNVKEKNDKSFFSSFAMQDAFAKRQPKGAWIEYIKNVSNGVEPEIIHSQLISKVRDMLSILIAKKEDLKIHPFVYAKAKNDLQNWKKEELEIIYEKLIVIYHEARLGGEELPVSIEKIILNI